MTTIEYRPRIADGLLAKKLRGMGAVLIEGSKWCGKTTTAEQQAKSIIYMDNPRQRESNIEAVNVDPDLILNGDVPRLIDEWQIAPKLWDAVRYTVDRRKEDGQFILTGPAVPPATEDDIQCTHTGTGRIGRIRMRTMSLWESGDSTGKVSLKALFNGEKQSAVCNIDLERIAYLTCRGGWPRTITQDPSISLDRAIDYVNAVVHSDINRVNGTTKDPERAYRLLRSYARHIGSQVSASAISSDLS